MELTLEQQKRLEKFTWISEELKKNNIFIDDEADPSYRIPLKDIDSGKKLIHNLVIWQSFPKEDVVEMILLWKKNNLTK